MKSLVGSVVLLACFAAATPLPSAYAQSNAGQSGSGQSQPAAQNPAPAQQPPRTTTQTDANPFPEDTDSVPVVPTGNAPSLAPGDENSPGARTPMPAEDADPVRTPEDAADAADSSSSGSSSSLTGMGDLNPPDDDDTAHPGKHKKGDEDVVPEHHETAAEDEDVGSYYLSNKNWKAALSRFQSALVLDPDNPNVYWGLAEAERHTGDFAGARANYQKVREYDPGSRHAKDASKALEDPEIANAKPDAAAQPPAQPNQSLPQQ
jgi:tetratricopeptide (TPR) repeat protein